MKKIVLIIVVNLSFILGSQAQKFAYVDTDYILNKIPEFKQAQDKIDAFSDDWQKEIEGKYLEVEQMYRSYQQEQVLLTDEMKTKREEAIILKENNAKKLQQKIHPDMNTDVKTEELSKLVNQAVDKIIKSDFS